MLKWKTLIKCMELKLFKRHSNILAKKLLIIQDMKDQLLSKDYQNKMMLIWDIMLIIMNILT